MHNAVIQVPMVVQGIGGLNDNGLVQHADVVRTLLEVAGAETETVQGVDLREERREYAISQSPEDSLDPLLEHNPDYDISRFPAEPYSVIQDGEFKYYGYPDEPELYRLPDERENVSPRTEKGDEPENERADDVDRDRPVRERSTRGDTADVPVRGVSRHRADGRAGTDQVGRGHDSTPPVSARTVLRPTRTAAKPTAYVETT
jgi:uncharacterized sulfatase